MNWKRAVGLVSAATLIAVGSATPVSAADCVPAPEAQCAGADLRGHNLGGADLRGANLTEVDPSGVQGNGGRVIRDLRRAVLCRTTLPNGRMSNRNC